MANHSARFPLVCLAISTCLLQSFQAPVGQTSDEIVTAPEPAAATKDLRRILHLEDGSQVRGRTRQSEGLWQLRRGPEWEPLARIVVRAVPERELLTELRRREARLDTNSVEQRVALVRWMLGEGLVEESYSQLDRLLRKDPDSADVQQLLREYAAPLQAAIRAEPGSASSFEAGLRFGAGTSPARAEVAIAYLRSLAPTSALSDLVRVELRAAQPQRRAFAVQFARRLEPKEYATELLDRALMDGMGDVREAACQALKQSDEVQIIAAPIHALSSRNAMLRKNALEALSALGHPAAVEPLVGHLHHLAAGGGAPSGTRAHMFVGLQTTYVMDYDVEIAQGASIADPVLAVQSSGVMFDARTAVQITREIELLTTIRSLQKLTGRKELSTAAAWSKWWEENSASWRTAELLQERPHLREVGPTKS